LSFGGKKEESGKQNKSNNQFLAVDTRKFLASGNKTTGFV
jgi:hypothetical protein